MKGQITPWYPSNIKPVRSGWYEVKNFYGRYFAYYDIGFVNAWYGGEKGTIFLNYKAQKSQWRGITKDNHAI